MRAKFTRLFLHFEGRPAKNKKSTLRWLEDHYCRLITLTHSVMPTSFTNVAMELSRLGTAASSDRQPRTLTTSVMDPGNDDSRIHPAMTKNQPTNQTFPEFPVIGEFDIDMDEDKPRISCCYGIGVFFCLAVALLALTGMVIYAGFWYNLQMNGKPTYLQVGDFVCGP